MRDKEAMRHMEKNSKMTEASFSLPVITSNINGLNPPGKR